MQVPIPCNTSKITSVMKYCRFSTNHIGYLYISPNEKNLLHNLHSKSSLYKLWLSPYTILILPSKYSSKIIHLFKHIIYMFHSMFHILNNLFSFTCVKIILYRNGIYIIIRFNRTFRVLS